MITFKYEQTDTGWIGSFFVPRPERAVPDHDYRYIGHYATKGAARRAMTSAADAIHDYFVSIGKTA
jgi:hypothetical protein